MLVKLLTGKTLHRHRTGNPGSLAEFFEMARECGETRVQACLCLGQSGTSPHPLNEGYKDSMIQYRAGGLEFDMLIIPAFLLPSVAPDVVPVRSDGDGDHLRSEDIMQVLQKQYELYTDLYEGFTMEQRFDRSAW